MPKVLVSSRSFAQITSVGEEILTEAGFEVHRIGPEERPLDAAKMARIVSREDPDVIISGAEPITAEVLAASSRLRMIMKHGVGVDNIDLGAATSLRIMVANAPGTNTEAVADWVIGAMLSLLRGICAASDSTRAGKWERFVGRELGARIVGVIGTGRIGTGVIKRLHGFGATMQAHDVVQNDELASNYGVRYVSLDELLGASDLVTLHVPLMEQTKGMIGVAELSRMKETAFLINAARGELVDEAALCEHLKAGRIAGAALDVYSTEPPLASPLIKLDNVLATPHIAAYTYEAMECMDRMCAETISATFAGKRSPNLLNPAVLGESS